MPRQVSSIVCLISLLFAGGVGCSGARHLAVVDPFLEETAPAGIESPAQKRPNVQLASAAAPDGAAAGGAAVTADYSALEVADAGPNASAASSASASRTLLERSVRHAAYEERPGVTRIGDAASSASSVVPAGHQQASGQHAAAPPPAYCPPLPVSHTPYPAPRLAHLGPEAYPDEYLFDGGDRGYPVHYSDYAREGLDTEDTIAEYTDHLGRPQMKPSTRVAVYSPRFGAVRTFSALKSDFAVEKLAGAFDTAFGVGLDTRTGPTMHQQRDAVRGVRVRSRASGLETEAAQSGLDQTTALLQHTKFVNTYQDLGFVRSGLMKQTDRARLAYGIQAALTWTRDLNPAVLANLQSGAEILGTFRGEELVGVDDTHKTAGRLRIVKLADKKIAPPGEIVTFTLRYDNLGDLEVFNVRLIDNLTPRLEFLEDSFTSDRPGQLTLEDNQEGSHIVQFELDQPLPGGAGGVITFQARVK